MDRRMLRCMVCGRYTMDEICPLCKGRAATPHPPRFSPEDRYGKYRRRLKALARAGGATSGKEETPVSAKER